MATNDAIQLLYIGNNANQIKTLSKELSAFEDRMTELIPCNSTDKANHTLSTKNIDIILIDIDNEKEANVKKLHQEFPEIPIIVLTSSTDTNTETTLISVGIQDYLIKDYLTSYVLLHAIKRALERHKLLLALKTEQENVNKLLTAVESGHMKKFIDSNDKEQLTKELGIERTEQNTRLLLLKAQRQKQAEALLTDLESRYSLILESAGEGICGLDAEGRTTFINPAAEKLLGYEPGELIGKNQHEIIHHTTIKNKPYSIKNCPIHAPMQDKGVIQGSDEFFWRKNNTPLPIEYTCTPIIENNKLVGKVINFRDITERKQIEKQMTRLALQDPLTTLANRLQFERMLKSIVAQAERYQRLLALLFVDLDDFKKINDNLGHDIGDQLLRDVAQRLCHCVRQNDLVARLGGDEFAIILSEIKNEQDAEIVAQKIISALNTPYQIGDHRIRISGSVGIACFPRSGNTPTELLKHADIAMYRAKELGRNNYQYFSKAIKQKNLQRARIENALREAIENKEFYLEFQPTFDLSSQKMISVETLLRWQSATLGMVTPEKFVPIAEESGLLIFIGEWVLEEACKEYHKWQKICPYTIKLSINLSPRQFIKHDLPDKLIETLKKYDISPSAIELELTETAIMSEAEVEGNLKKLAALGVKIAIDDFGTGYSSLSRLKYLPISTLKIDKTFIHDITENINDAAIVDSILALAKELGLNVIAEGIETEEQLEYLKKRGCQQGQGFYFCNSLNKGGIKEFIKRQ